MSHTDSILIVDDDPRFCDSLKVLLGNQGYQMQIGNSGNTKTCPLNCGEYSAIGLKQDSITAIEERLEASRDEIESILKAIA